MKYLNKEINGITLSRIGLGAMRMADVQQIRIFFKGFNL